GVDNLYDPRYIELVHHVNQGLRAHTTMERDKAYVVKDGKVIIVDEFTGRLMEGRRWSNGLHQAVEAKEGVAIERENLTLATITFQNYFRLYKKLAGMTGTADTEAVEFKKIYNLDVSIIPTNMPMIREDCTDMVFKTRKEKYEQVVKDIVEINKTGQPILVGTVSIEQSEALSKMLSRYGVEHNVLNAKHHEREAEIVAQAGHSGMVTIATNMAGRGTDIVLGGNPEFLAASEAKTKDRDDPKFQKALEKYKRICQEDRKKVVEAGGLFIIGTERHEARRIDNQLRGRSGRQGDPGKSRFYVALEDDLMRRFGGEKIQALMQRFGWEEGVAIDGRLISRTIENAQIKVERLHFEQRKHLLEYDDVMRKQREVIYNLRNRVLHMEDIHNELTEMLIDVVEEEVLATCEENVKATEWDLSSLADRIKFLTNKDFKFPDEMILSQQGVFDCLKEFVLEAFKKRVEEQELKLKEIETLASGSGMNIGFSGGRFDFVSFEQSVLLENLDRFWNMHLQEMDDLRDAIGLRAYGQKNPLYEYQSEGFIAFQGMLKDLRAAVIREIFLTEFVDPQSLAAHIETEKRRREARQRHMATQHRSMLEASDDGEGRDKRVSKNPDAEKARLQEQKKQRRKEKAR
ncbi:MAG: preprotein translocase subunit SecA, partial [SAR324 cluster bacterium]|nr:preprotein translocase subunit SecA [SAR324 cluster bacterium]